MTMYPQFASLERVFNMRTPQKSHNGIFIDVKFVKVKLIDVGHVHFLIMSGFFFSKGLLFYLFTCTSLFDLHPVCHPLLVIPEHSKCV